MTLPDFLILGAARCGTTSLHYYLTQHPDICMSSIKEPNFFLFEQTPDGPRPCIADRRIIAKSVSDREHYERLFTKPAVATGEASPLYLYTRESPALIRARAPEARLIAIVREPVDRAWSHFVYVNDTLGADTAAAFAQAVDDELAKGYEPYRTGTHFLRLSAYAEQLDRYRDQFPAEQMLVLSYDDLVGRTTETLGRICGFLGVTDVTFDTSVQYNPSSTTRIARIDRFIRPAYPYLKKALPAAVTGRLARGRARLRATGRGSDAVALPPGVRAKLAEHFAPDLEWLEREAAITFPAQTR